MKLLSRLTAAQQQDRFAKPRRWLERIVYAAGGWPKDTIRNIGHLDYLKADPSAKSKFKDWSIELTQGA